MTSDSTDSSTLRCDICDHLATHFIIGEATHFMYCEEHYRALRHTPVRTSHDMRNCWCPSQYVCDGERLMIGYDCPKCGLTDDAECDYGGWHNESQYRYVNPSEVRDLLKRIVTDL